MACYLGGFEVWYSSVYGSRNGTDCDISDIASPVADMDSASLGYRPGEEAT